MRRLAVYCGASIGTDPAFAALARTLGEEMAARGIGLVYGGGRLGLMGVVADAVIEAGAIDLLFANENEICELAD
ncbi:MAG: hypothetical protein QOJ53_2371, partial [Sphingomonadales bacterium]|nr:hypothetical protein [Sphingomonadales bacterium]